MTPDPAHFFCGPFSKEQIDRIVAQAKDLARSNPTLAAIAPNGVHFARAVDDPRAVTVAIEGTSTEGDRIGLGAYTARHAEGGFSLAPMAEGEPAVFAWE
ncbi:MAG: hypothetical protein JSR82_23750 [Verrucomicrobia bacterium]|nr:hypothetical protein [Verrucomicrobiota bacterium]